MMKAVIDADFYRKLTENEFNADLFIDVMRDLNMIPVMHKYVYKQELRNDRYINELVNNDKIKIYDYCDYISSESEREEYKKYFYDSYEQLTGLMFPKSEDIYTYHAVKENLGEIRSIYLALKLNIPYFATDDGGAISFVKNRVSNSLHSVKTISVEEAICICKNNGTKLTWKDFKNCIHNSYKNDSKKIQRIHDILA